VTLPTLPKLPLPKLPLPNLPLPPAVSGLLNTLTGQQPPPGGNASSQGSPNTLQGLLNYLLH
jgi:hypothetical protein